MIRQQFYSLKKIKSYDATYNIIIGQRSNGKTFAVLQEIVENYFKFNQKGAVIRRWREAFKGNRGPAYFDNLVKAGLVKKLSDGKWNGIEFYRRAWYMIFIDADGNKVREQEPFCYSFALTEMENDKGNGYPDVWTILFDEFLTRGQYLPEEFVLFMNTLSTIIRRRTGVKIYMCGNTVNKYCPYFKEMGVKHINDMKPGDIAVYKTGDDKLKIAVEYADKKTTADVDYYFAFDNPRLQMITGGFWEVDIYPHLPYKYRPMDVLYNFFIQWENELLHCELINGDNGMFIFIHPKTTELQKPETELVYSPEPSYFYNRLENIFKPTNKLTKGIAQLFATGKVFYSSNEVGEIVRNYLNWCRTTKR